MTTLCFLGWVLLISLVGLLPVAGEWLSRTVSPVISYTAATWPSNGTALAVGANVRFHTPFAFIRFMFQSAPSTRSEQLFEVPTMV